VSSFSLCSGLSPAPPGGDACTNSRGRPQSVTLPLERRLSPRRALRLLERSDRGRPADRGRPCREKSRHDPVRPTVRPFFPAAVRCRPRRNVPVGCRSATGRRRTCRGSAPPGLRDMPGIRGGVGSSSTVARCCGAPSRAWSELRRIGNYGSGSSREGVTCSSCARFAGQGAGEEGPAA
jgi:hypothetical protein